MNEEKIESLLSKLTPSGIEVSNVINGGIKTGRETAEASATRATKTIKLSASDVAAGLAGLDNGPYYFALAKYAADEEAGKKLGEYLERIINKMWQLDPLQSKVLALLAMEHQVWGILCKRCEGRGSLRNVQRKYRDCDKCDGSGRGSLKKARMAEMLCVSPQAFGKTWNRRLAIVCSIVTEYHEKVSRHLWKKFS